MLLRKILFLMNVNTEKEHLIGRQAGQLQKSKRIWWWKQPELSLMMVNRVSTKGSGQVGLMSPIAQPSTRLNAGSGTLVITTLCRGIDLGKSGKLPDWKLSGWQSAECEPAAVCPGGQAGQWPATESVARRERTASLYVALWYCTSNVVFSAGSLATYSVAWMWAEKNNASEGTRKQKLWGLAEETEVIYFGGDWEIT